MPAPSGSTPVFGLPYLLETDIPDVATASQLLAQAVENVLETVGVPVGGDINWWSDTLPAIGNWAFLHGQRLIGGASVYLTLKALYPSWVSGSDIILPDTRNNAQVGAGGLYAVGSTGGTATVQLVGSNIPQMTASVSLSGHAHNHGGAVGGEAAHNHTFSASTILNQAGPGADAFQHSWTGANQYNFSAILGMITGPGSNHNHGIPTDNMSGAAGSVTIGTATPSAISKMQPYIASHRIIRLS